MTNIRSLFSLFSAALLLSYASVHAKRTLRVKEQKTRRKKPLKTRRERTSKFLPKKKSLASILFPGVAPQEYYEDSGEGVPIWVDLVESKKTQVPIKYYDLPGSCSGPSTKKSSFFKKSLGQKLMGSSVMPSPYEQLAVKSSTDGCKVACVSSLDKNSRRKLAKLISQQYRVHLTLDDMPVVMKLESKTSNINYAVTGYPLGFLAPPSYSGRDKDEYFIYNHLKFIVRYREDQDFEGVRIVGFEAKPVSYTHEFDGRDVPTCYADTDDLVNSPETNMHLSMDATSPPTMVAYTYEVDWIQSDIYWSDRWDIYMQANPSEDIHYFAILNSFMIAMFLTALVATIMLRTLRKEISAYNSQLAIMDDEDEELMQDESGWKLVHGDVFRPPSHMASMILSVGVGTGTQIGVALLCVILCSFLPYPIITPMNKGRTLTVIIFLYVLSGSAAGYTSARIYKLCNGKDWKRNTLYTAGAFPVILLGLFLVLDFFLAFAGAATSVSVWTIISMFLLWLCVATPLVFIGSFIGFKREKIEVPVKVNQIARVIPDIKDGSMLTQYAKPPYSFVLGGLLPFGSICIELFFVMNSIWLYQVYYFVGFLMAAIVVVAATSAQVAIVMCYLQLCAEDHQWWTRAFFNCSSAGAYLFVYSLWFLSSKLDLVGTLPIMVYLTYMSMISMAFGLFLGAVGFLSCLQFTRTIYGALKVD